MVQVNNLVGNCPRLEVTFGSHIYGRSPISANGKAEVMDNFEYALYVNPSIRVCDVIKIMVRTGFEVIEHLKS